MGLMDELKKIIHPYDDEDYDYEDDFEEPAKESRSLFDDRKEERRDERRREAQRQKKNQNPSFHFHSSQVYFRPLTASTGGGRIKGTP